jgi:hypothetical protein
MIYFSVQLRTILLQERVDQAALSFLNFLVTQRAIIGPVFNAQRHCSLSRRNAFAFVGPHKLGAATLGNVFFLDCA